MVICFAAGMAVGMAMNSGSTTKNLTETTVKTAVNVTNRAVMDLSARGKASNRFVIQNVARDLNLDGLSQGAEVQVSVSGYLQATNQTAVQQEVAQKLTQMAESVVSGIPIGEAKAENETRTFIETSSNILNETQVLCKAVGEAENEFTVSGVGRDANLRNISQNAVVSSILECQSNSISKTDATQKVSNTIDQVATAIVKGLDLSALLLPLIIIFGIVVAVFAGSYFLFVRSGTKIMETVFGPKVLPGLLVLGVVAVVVFVVLKMFVFKSPKEGGGVVLTCGAEQQGKGECLPLDDPVDPALQFPFMNTTVVRPEMGAVVVQPAAAENIVAAVAAARANPAVTCLLWDRDAKTWTGFSGRPDPSKWVATVREDRTLEPSRYTVHGSRYNVLGLIMHGTRLLRGLYCIALGVRGGFDASRPDAEPSASLCREIENTTSEGTLKINGVDRPLTADQKPKPTDYEWDPLRTGTSGNLWSSIPPERLFYLLRGVPGNPQQKFDYCISGNEDFTTLVGCSPDQALRRTQVESLLGFMRARYDAVVAQAAVLKPDQGALTNWLVLYNAFKADVEKGYEAYNTGDASDINTVKDVAVLFPLRTKTGVATQKGASTGLVWGIIGTAVFLLIAMALFIYAKWRSRPKEAPQAAKEIELSPAPAEVGRPTSEAKVSKEEPAPAAAPAPAPAA